MRTRKLIRRTAWLTLLLLIAGCQEKKADTSRESLIELASIALTPMSTNRDASPRADEARSAESLNQRLEKCRRIVARNDDMQPLAVQAETVLSRSSQLLEVEKSGRGETLVLALLSLGKLQDKPPAVSEFAGERLADRINARAAEVEQIRGELGVCQTGVFAAGKRLSRGERDFSSSFDCAFEEQGWLLTGFAPDKLVLQYKGPQQLTNVFLAVSLAGGTGESRSNLHFVPTISPGETLYANYSGGFTQGAIKVGRQTVQNAQSVKVEVWCSEGVAKNVTAQIRRAKL